MGAEAMTEIDLKLKFKAKVPTVPNFILAADGSDRKVPIEELDEATLKEIGNAWTVSLLWAAKNRRNGKTP
jgi:hypothetical protein